MTHNTKEVVTKKKKKKKYTTTTTIKKNNTINLIFTLNYMQATPRIEIKSNWDLKIPKLNHLAFQY